MQDALPSYSFFSEQDFRPLPPKSVSLDRSLSPDVFEAPSPPCFHYPEAVSPADEGTLAAFRKELLHFFYTGEGGGLSRSGNLKPALLASFFRSQLPGIGYPVWMPDQESFSQEDFPEGRCWSVSEILQKAVARFAPGDEDSVLLKAHLGRIGRIIRQKLGGAVHAASLWGDAFKELQKELQLKGVEGLQLASDLHKLQRTLPPGGLLIPFSPWGHSELFLGLQVGFRQKQIRQTEAKAALVLSRLRSVLVPSGGDSDTAGALVGVPGLEGEVQLKGMLGEIELTLEALQQGPCLLLGRQFYEKSMLNLELHFPGCKFEVMEETELFGAALKIFEKNASLLVRLLAVLEAAGNVLDDRSKMDRKENHSGLLVWDALSEAEKALCPPISILIDSASLSEKALSGFFDCLGRGYPVKVLATSQGGVKQHTDLAAAAISIKKALVVQSAALDPNTLLLDFSKGFEGSGPAFFHVFGQIPSAANSTGQYFLHACAALDSRVFPAICYKPENDLRWGQRFMEAFNPQPECDWTVHQLEVKADKGVHTQSLGFTAVDFAALDPSLASGFKVVPPEYQMEDLVPLEDYPLDGEGAEIPPIPFIWMADEQLQLNKVAISLSMLRFYRSCLDSWRYVQENIGIHNYHAERAVESYKNQIKPALEVSKGQQVQAAELEAYASKAVQAAMEALAASLLGFPQPGISAAPLTLDASPNEGHVVVPEETIPLPIAPEQVVDTPMPEGGVPAPEVPAPAAKVLEVDAWIDTPLCTSCSECVDNFPQIFSYNDDKQAFVASPRGGTYVDLVLAAERCPVSIIHPGTPWDRSDPDLAELIERARPFQ